MQKSGAWYSYGGERIGQGKDNARVHLREHPEQAAALEAALRGKLLPQRADAPGADDGEDGR